MRIIEDIWYTRLSMNVALILDNCLLHRTRDYVKERQRRISEADRLFSKEEDRMTDVILMIL